jgi:hypothetical protein
LVRDLWGRLPSFVRALTSLIGGIFGLVVFFSVLEMNPVGGVAGELLGLVLAIAVFAFVFWLIIRSVRKSAGGKDQMRLMRRALKTGVVPEGAQSESWTETLTRARDRRRDSTWVFILFAGLIVLVNVVSLAQYPEVVSDSLKLLLFIGFTALLLAGWVGLPMLIVRRNQRRIDRLFAELERSDSRPPSG